MTSAVVHYLLRLVWGSAATVPDGVPFRRFAFAKQIIHGRLCLAKKGQGQERDRAVQGGGGGLHQTWGCKRWLMHCLQAAQHSVESIYIPGDSEVAEHGGCPGAGPDPPPPCPLGGQNV